MSGLWSATVAVVRRERALLLPVAGAFILLPQLAAGLFMEPAAVKALLSGSLDAGGGRLLIALAVSMLVSTIGQLALTDIVLGGADGAGTTVRQSLAAAFSLLIPASAYSFMQGFVTGIGVSLFVLPGMYLFSRLLFGLPILLSESSDPLYAIRRSWKLTTGRSLRIFSIVLIFMTGLLLVGYAASGLAAALGVVSTVAGAERHAGAWLVNMATAFVFTAAYLYFLAFVAILYRHVAALDDRGDRKPL